MPSICWHMTEVCNLKCSFCYAFKNKEHPSYLQLRDIGEQLEKQGVKEINLTGGEPLLNKATYGVIDEFSDRMDLSLTTNGTIFPNDKDKIKILKKLKRVCVSIDAISSELFNKMRGAKERQVQTTLSSLAKFVHLGVRVEINTVVNRENIDHLDHVAQYLNKNFPDIRWRIFEMTINNNVAPQACNQKINHELLILKMSRIKQYYPSLDVRLLPDSKLNSEYLIVDCSGSLFIPGYNNYKSIGSVQNDLNGGVMLVSVNKLKNEIHVAA